MGAARVGPTNQTLYAKHFAAQRAATRQPAQRPHVLFLFAGPASSIAAPFEEGICGPLHRWSGPHTIRIGGRVLSIPQ